jgi:serine protease
MLREISGVAEPGSKEHDLLTPTAATFAAEALQARGEAATPMLFLQRAIALPADEGRWYVRLERLRYAARHGAKVINMSFEFPISVNASAIREIVSAVHYAHCKGAVVVGSSGNEAEARVAYPARTDGVISVGATTDDGCLASFSNDGAGIDLVAPGGGEDANLSRDPNCRPGHSGRPIYQMTFVAPGRVTRFGLPSGFDGTSMAAPHVSATAALIIQSKILGTHPTPAQVECRLKATAHQLGLPSPNRVYGYGLLDAGAATSPAIPTPQCLATR